MCGSRQGPASSVCSSLSPRADDRLLAITSTRSTPRLVSTTASVSRNHIPDLILATSCLAEAVLLSTSPASATAPALATSPTSSNGTSHNAISSPNAVNIVVAPFPRPCSRLRCPLYLPAPFRCAMPASLLPSMPVRLPPAPTSLRRPFRTASQLCHL